MAVAGAGGAVVVEQPAVAPVAAERVVVAPAGEAGQRPAEAAKSSLNGSQLRAFSRRFVGPTLEDRICQRAGTSPYAVA